MKNGCVGFLTVAGFLVWFLNKYPGFIRPLLLFGGVLLGIFLFFFVVWYGWITIRCLFRF